MNIYNQKIFNDDYGRRQYYSFVQNIKKALKQYKITQEIFARSIGVSKQTLNNYLSRRRKITLNIAFRMASSLTHLIPRFNMMYLFVENQDILTHDKINYVYSEENTVIQKLDDNKLNLLYKMLRNPFLPGFLNSINIYFNNPTSTLNNSKLSCGDWLNIQKFISTEDFSNIIKYFVLLLYQMAPNSNQAFIDLFIDKNSSVDYSVDLAPTEHKALNELLQNLADEKARAIKRREKEAKKKKLTEE